MAEKINIPIFYACDEGFVKFTVVSIHSLMVNASPDYHYSIYILHTGIAPEVQQKALSLAREGFDIIFTDVSERLHTITDVLPVRDYYSNTTYFRLFIADMFPEYDKVIYIDGDSTVPISARTGSARVMSRRWYRPTTTAPTPKRSWACRATTSSTRACC